MNRKLSCCLCVLVVVANICPSVQIPRPKKKDPQTCSAGREISVAASTAKAYVERSISEHSVLMFGKTYCPYTQKAERALASLLPKDALVNISLDLRRGDGEHIQDALLKITGRRTVPQVFISGQFFGGGDETAAALESGELSRMLRDQGIL